MKKIILSSLFSATLLMGATASFAEEIVPADPNTPAIEIPADPSTPVVTPTEPTTPVEPPIDPVTPPLTPSEPTVPVEPEQPTEPTTPTEPTDPSTPIAPTEPTTPTEPSQPMIPREPTEPSITPSISEESTKPEEKPKEDKETKPKEDKPIAPAKEVTVSVDPFGKITNDASQGTNVPIVTSDVKEISYVPTPKTPLKVAGGQTIVGVLDGIPLVQNEQGESIKDPSIPVKVLKSGNIEVKTADGKTKILPKTGEEINMTLSLVGSLCTFFSGLIWWKKRA